MKRTSQNQKGSTLVVTIVVVATLLVLLGVAVDYSTEISRNTQRSRKTALAMEIADGHLETLFTNWRNIYRTTWYTYGMNTGGSDYSVVGTNFFATAMYTPSVAATPIPGMTPAVTPPVIPVPTPSLFPTEANYQLTKYRIVAVDPMIDLDASENPQVETGGGGSGSFVALSPSATPPAAYGPNIGPYGYYYPYSYFYLASADVTVPALAGNVTAKVRRVFEKKFDLPWRYLLFYVDDLELQPTTALTVNGPIHTNGSLYIGNNNFTTSSWVEYGMDYVNGYSPADPRYPGSGFTTPNFAKSDASLTLSDCPPGQVAPYLPFGWNLSFTTVNNNTSGGYHEIIERPDTSVTDPVSTIRYYNQQGLRITISADGTSVTVQSIDSTGAVTTYATNNATFKAFWANNGGGSSSTILKTSSTIGLFDARENAAVKVNNVYIDQIIGNIGSLPSGWNGVLYLCDLGATIYNSDGTVKTAGTGVNMTISGTSYPSVTRRAFRLLNGYALPSTGLTIVSENPVYIQGNYNTSATAAATPPSNSGTYTSPTASGYTRKASAVIADAVTVLSGAWNDSNSNASISTRAASNTTINTAIGSGIVPSSSTAYSGGGENFIRLLEDWKSNTFCYYGSMMQLYRSNQAIGVWTGAGNTYKAPLTTKYYYDSTIFADACPPGNLQLAAYLQQQRWYQVY